MFCHLLNEPIEYRDPWDEPLEERLGALRRGSRRIAWLYEKPDSSTFRYRCFNPPRTLAAARPDIGAAWFQIGELEALSFELRALTVLVICRVRYNAGIGRLVARAKGLGVKVIFDCDDLVFNPDYAHLIMETLDQDTSMEAAWDIWFAALGRLQGTAALCDAGITTNDFLGERLRQTLKGAPVGIIPNYFDRAQQELSARLFAAKAVRGFKGDGRITIGYFSGTPTHNRDFAVAASAIARLMHADPGVDLRIVGFAPPTGPLAELATRIEIVPLQDYLNLQRVIAEVEVNIAPLQDNVFTNCKSELKYFEAAAVGTWTIASPTHTFRHAIEDGKTGRLAQAHEWDNALQEAVALARDPAAYGERAHVAAEAVKHRYAWDGQAAAILDATGLEVAPATGLSRAQQLMADIPRDEAILEIGASYAPLAPKAMGWRTTVVDHADAEELRVKYSEVELDRTAIEDVDVVWTGGPLHEAVREKHAGQFRALLISHVLEHIPDPISLLQSADRLLTPDGEIVVAVPDKRYCFDAHRWPSTAGAMLQAHVERRSRHPPGLIFDEVSLSVTRGGKIAWPPGTGGALRLVHPAGRAAAVFQSQLAPDAPYADAHAWQFTPSSLELVLLDLRLASQIPWIAKWVTPTSTGEIFARLVRNPTPDRSYDPDAIQGMRESLLGKIASEMFQALQTPAPGVLLR